MIRDLPDLKSPPGNSLSPVAEFGRWFLVASVLAVLSTLALKGFDRIGAPRRLEWIFGSAIWICFHGGEAWIQFHGLWRRYAWAGVGAITGACFAANPTGWIFIFPGLLEWVVARGQRKRAWVWPIVTALVYGTARWWSEVTYDVVKKVIDLTSPFLGTMVSIDLFESWWAAVIASILIARAAVGSFIASRVSINSGG